MVASMTQMAVSIKWDTAYKTPDIKQSLSKYKMLLLKEKLIYNDSLNPLTIFELTCKRPRNVEN